MNEKLAQSSTGNQSPLISGDGNSVSYGVRKKLANETTTMLQVVTLIPKIASENFISSEEVDYSRDIKLKIEERFFEFKEELKGKLQNLQALYSDAYSVAKENSGLDEFRLREYYNLLRNLSIKVLGENGNNPVKALEALTGYFKEEFANSECDDFSEQAVEYFLYRELIECNVFPNIEIKNY